jgi:hypothetical protein
VNGRRKEILESQTTLLEIGIDAMAATKIVTGTIDAKMMIEKTTVAEPRPQPRIPLLSRMDMSLRCLPRTTLIKKKARYLLVILPDLSPQPLQSDV